MSSSAPERPGSPRRREARRRGVNGLDAVDVTPGKDPTLVLTFFGRAPDLHPGNIRIDGGRSIRSPRAVRVRRVEQDIEDVLLVDLDRWGDWSRYTLRLVSADRHGRPGQDPLPDLDPRANAITFSFRDSRRRAVDCAGTAAPAPDTVPTTAISYLAKDYASFRQLLLDRLAVTSPTWRERHVPDLQLTLIELLAYVGDYLSYHQDAVATEAYLRTARQRISVRRHARLLDYPMHDGCNARVWVRLEADDTVQPVTLAPATYCFATGPSTGTPWPVLVDRATVAAAFPDVTTVFEPVIDEPVTLWPSHNEIQLWTWGEDPAILPTGATTATLKGALASPAGDNGGKDPPGTLHLQAGDVLLLAETRGRRTALPHDADPTKRWVVRLTSVRPARDPVFDRDIVEVTWASADALPFPLHLSVPSEERGQVVPSAFASGNVVLADHGARRSRLDGSAESSCVVRDDVVLAGRPVTCATPYPDPELVAATQANMLRGLVAEVSAWLWALERQVEDGRALGDHDVAELTRLLGRAALVDARLVSRHRPDEPRHRTAAEQLRPVRELVSRSPGFLAATADRLAELAERTAAGTPLDPLEVDEVAAIIGSGRLTDESVLRGPASVVLTQQPADALPAIDVHVSPPDAAGGDVDDPGIWMLRRDLLDSGPTDRTVVAEIDDDGAAHLRFGDGQAGRPVGVGSTIVADYRIGNGAAGNVAAGVITHLVVLDGTPPAVTRVSNPLPAQGGIDPETIDDVRVLAPEHILTSGDRAVIAEDYARIAGGIPGVQRAAATLSWSATCRKARVAIDPLGREDLDPTLKAEIVHRLEPCRRIGHVVTVQPADYVPLDIAVRIETASDFDPRQVEHAARAAFRAGVARDGSRGFFHPDNFTFGARIPVSRLVAAARAVPGVREAWVTRLERHGEGDRGELAAGVLALGPLEIPRVDDDGDPRHGRFHLTGPVRPARTAGPVRSDAGVPVAADGSAPTQVVVSGRPGSEERWTPPAVVRVVGGRDVERWLLHRTTTTIGRETEMTIQVGPEFESVSRRHAVFIRSGDQVQIEDIGSRNGILVDGQPVRLAVLTDGDEITIGEWTLRFEAARPKAAEENPEAASDA